MQSRILTSKCAPGPPVVNKTACTFQHFNFEGGMVATFDTHLPVVTKSIWLGKFGATPMTSEIPSCTFVHRPGKAAASNTASISMSPKVVTWVSTPCWVSFQSCLVEGVKFGDGNGWKFGSNFGGNDFSIEKSGWTNIVQPDVFFLLRSCYNQAPLLLVYLLGILQNVNYSHRLVIYGCFILFSHVPIHINQFSFFPMICLVSPEQSAGCPAARGSRF